MKLHITETALSQLVVPAGKKWLAAYDTELSGFVAIKTESGAMSYVVMYRNQDGQKRQEKLAAVGSVSAQAARGMARSRLADLAQCEFRPNLDTDSGRIWTVIPRQTGH